MNNDIMLFHDLWGFMYTVKLDYNMQGYFWLPVKIKTRRLATTKWQAFVVDRVKIGLTASLIIMQNSVVISHTVSTHVKRSQKFGDWSLTPLRHGYPPLKTCNSPPIHIPNFVAICQAILEYAGVPKKLVGAGALSPCCMGMSNPLEVCCFPPVLLCHSF